MRIKREKVCGPVASVVRVRNYEEALVTANATEWPQRRQAGGFQGLSKATPIGSKSVTLRVTSVMPCTSAVAAIRPSR